MVTSSAASKPAFFQRRVVQCPLLLAATICTLHLCYSKFFCSSDNIVRPQHLPIAMTVLDKPQWGKVAGSDVLSVWAEDQGALHEY